jgi:hypothetical protein
MTTSNMVSLAGSSATQALAAASASARRTAGDAGTRLARLLEIEQFLLHAGWGENGCAAWAPAGTPANAVLGSLPPHPTDE